MSYNRYRDSSYCAPGYANPGSALRAASERNQRNLPCPTCRQPNMLTPADKRKGYQCDNCADAEEGYF